MPLYTEEPACTDQKFHEVALRACERAAEPPVDVAGMEEAALAALNADVVKFAAQRLVTLSELEGSWICVRQSCPRRVLVDGAETDITADKLTEAWKVLAASAAEAGVSITETDVGRWDEKTRPQFLLEIEPGGRFTAADAVLDWFGIRRRGSKRARTE